MEKRIRLPILLAIPSVLSLLIVQSLFAVPIIHNSDYSIELVASGLGAVTGIAIAPTGDIFATDYQGGNVYKIDQSTYAAETYATGLSNSTDITFDGSGNMFVTSGSGSPRDILQVYSDGSTSQFSTGYSYTVGLEFAPDGYLYTGNSGNGTISKIDSAGEPQTFLSGYGGPNGPFGIAFDDLGNLYFVQHGTGEVYISTPDGSVSQLASLTHFGPTYIEVDSSGIVYVADSLKASIYSIDAGIVSLFASGFTGKSYPPVIGPSGLEFDDLGNLYIGDGEHLYKVSPNPVPEPATILLLSTGLFGLAGWGRKKFRRS